MWGPFFCFESPSVDLRFRAFRVQRVESSIGFQGLGSLSGSCFFMRAPYFMG